MDWPLALESGVSNVSKGLILVWLALGVLAWACAPGLAAPSPEPLLRVQPGGGFTLALDDIL